MDAIGVRLAILRRQLGLTQTELAEKMGINQWLISDYEVGRVKLSADMLALFAQTLGSTSDEILGLTPPDQEQAIPLKIIKRLHRIQALPPSKQKAVLQSLDLTLAGIESSAQT